MKNIKEIPPYIIAWLLKYKRHGEQEGSGDLVFTEGVYGQPFTKFDISGQTEQEGTPTPENEVPIQNCTGFNYIYVAKENLFTGNIVQGNISVSTGEETDATNRCRTDSFIEVNSNDTYIIKTNKRIDCLIFYYDEDNTYINNSGWKTMPYEYKPGETTKKIKIVFRYSNNANIIPSDITGLCVFNKGQIQTVQFSLVSGKYLASGDYLADDGIHHKWGQYIFTGNEDILNYSSSSYAFTVTVQLTNKKFDGNLKTVLCNKLQPATNTEIYNYRNQSGHNLIASTNYGNFNVMLNNYATAEDIQTYLATQYNNNTPVIVQYELAEEEVEPYTEAQAAEWDVIKELHTYLDYTLITQTNDGLAFILYVSVN